MGYNHYCQKHPAGIPVFPIKWNKKTEKESYPGKSNFHYLYLFFFTQCYFFFENKYIENTRFEDIVFRFYEDRNLRLYKRETRILKQIGFKDIENVKNLKI